MPVTTVIDTKNQEHFWNKLTQLKFDLNYYHQHFVNCVKILRWIRIGIVAVTAGVSGIWMTWSEIEWVRFACPIAVLVLQIFNAILEVFPYEKRKQELRELTNLLNPVYTDMENDWYLIADGQCTREEISRKLISYEKRRQDIQQHYLKDDALPERKHIVKKAEEDTSAYLSNL